METKLEYINLSDIALSKTNPRKTFDQNKIDELAESIAEHGVIQPVRLRPKQNRYELVCGERRYRASKQAGRKDIPAVISELTDQQAREIQLIENFQREDIHPMEEASAIFAAIRTGQYTTDDLAHKVGKSKRYIAQRMKLNELIPELQKDFFDDKFNLTSALMLVTISKDDQKKFYKEAVGNEYKYNTNQVQYYINLHQGNLTRAPFDLADPTLSPEFGACTTCPFNSRNANLLFPDDSKEQVCMNKQDYLKKIEVHFERASHEAFKDPAVVLISNNYQFGEEEKKLVSEGHVVLRPHHDYSIAEPPGREVICRSDYESGEEYEEAVIEANADYEKECLAFEKKQMTGKLVKAFVVAGDEKGKMTYVELEKKGAQKTATTVIHAGTAEINDVQTEIDRLNEKEERNKELDAEKVYAKVQAVFKEHKPFRDNKDYLSVHEYIGLAIALLNGAGYHAVGILEKALKLEGDSSRINIYKKLMKMQEKGLPVIFNFLRRVILNTSSTDNNPLNQGAPAIITTIAKDYIPDTVSDLEVEQQNISVARIERLNKRLGELENEKYALEQEAKAKKKKVKTVV